MVLINLWKDFKFFPIYEYKFKLLDNEKDSLERLVRRTEFSNNLISKNTNKSFIGKIENNSFKIISSEIGKGAIWVLNGFISKEKCEVFMVINQPFKILFSFLYILPFVGFIVQCLNEKTSMIPFFFIIAIGQFCILRFVILDYLFKQNARLSLYRLRDVVDFELIG